MIKKIFIGLFAFIILLVAALAVLPIIFKDKLVAIAREQANTQLNAKVDWTDIGVSAFKDFPNVSVYIKKLVIVNEEPFKGDTLAKVDELIVSVDPFKLIKGKNIDINAIKFYDPYFAVHVLKDGRANYDIVKPDTAQSTDTAKSSGSYHVHLKKFLLQNAHIIYDDKEEGIYTELTGFTNKLSGNFGETEFELKDNATAKSLTIKEGKITYINHVKTEFNASIDVDMVKGKYVLKDNSLKLNDLLLNLTGSVIMANDSDITLDLSLKAKEPDFKHLLSLLPAVYSEDFKKVKTTGALALEGFVKGKYTGKRYPAFGINLKVDKGSFQYPGLPAAVTGIDIDINAKNKGGSLDNTIIDVDKCAMNLAGDPLQMKLHITSPILDPEIESSLSCKINLAGVKNYYPMKGDELQGQVNIDIAAKGKLSAIEKQQYQDFNASGGVNITGVKYTSKDLAKPVKINELKLAFQPEMVRLDNFSAESGRSDIEASGELDNLLNYLFSKATLKGRLKVRSNVLDLNELLAETPKEVTVTTSKEEKSKPVQPTAKAAPHPSSTAAQVPARIDFVLDVYAGRIYYTNITLDSMAGELTIRNETVTLNNLQGKAFDGNMSLNGDYTTLMTETPKVDMAVKLDMISVNKAAKGFANMLSSIPAVQSMEGALSTVLNVKTDLDKEMNPQLKTMTADGQINVHHLEFNNKNSDAIAKKTRLGALKLIHFKNFVTTVKVAKGKLYVEPFHLPMGKIDITVYGSHDMTDSSSANYSMLMDAPADSVEGAGGKPGKRVKYKVGLNGKNDPNVQQASGDDDTLLQNATAEQEQLKNTAAQAKQESESKQQVEKDKRQQAADDKVRKKTERKQQQAEQKAKDQG